MALNNGFPFAVATSPLMGGTLVSGAHKKDGKMVVCEGIEARPNKIEPRDCVEKARDTAYVKIYRCF